MRHLFFYFLIILCGSYFTPRYAYADEQQDLQTIRQSIVEQEKKLLEQKQQRAKLLANLQQQETTIATLFASLDKNEKLLAQVNQDIVQLNPQIKLLEQQQSQQQTILAKQLEGAFKLGKMSSMELVFSGEQSDRNERIITYYGYINEERQHRINELKRIQNEIAQKRLILEQKHSQQQKVLNTQITERDTLVANQKARQQTVKALDISMQLNQQKLEELKNNAAQLQTQINKAEQQNQKVAEEEAKQVAKIQAKQQNYNYKPTSDERALMARVSGIGKPMQKLNRPVSGNTIHHFGQPQQGELKWKGLVIKAKEGTPVKAIADGRVILASWLQGYGFIVALDHGKGDMTLYGYNQRVLVNVGDKIKSGQAVALVGESGGQGFASLYFEVRRDGKALDPNAWLKK